MKTNRMLILLGFLGSLILSSCAQELSQGISVVKLLESRKFVFVAETAIPMSGGSIQLVSNYEVKLLNDTLQSELPYFGTAYSAPMGRTSSPLSFSSTSFNYELQSKGNDKFNLEIKLKVPNDPDRMDFSISSSGYGRLTVTSIYRQLITFNGFIKEIPKPKR